MGPAQLKSGLVVLPKDLSIVSPTNTTPSIVIKPIKVLSKGEDGIVPLYVACDEKQTMMVVELVKFVHTHGSWLIVPQDSELVPQFCRNGNLTFITKVDPLFAILIIMDYNSKFAKTDVFQPLDALCTIEDGLNLSRLTSEQQVSLLCDSKEAGGESFYRLSKEKALSWILRKHHLLAQHPRVNAQHASDIVSQYLNDRWTAMFRNSLESQAPPKEAPSMTESPADLAMSIMMNDAKVNNIATHMPQPNGKRKQPQGKNKTPSKKKKQEVNKGAAEWWASQRSSHNTRKTTARKKTLRSTATR